LEQADALLKAAHKVPAAVLVRVALERWIRDQAEKAGIPGFDSQKPSRLNDDLKGNGIFSKPKWGQVQSVLHLGNSSAHGKADEFTEQDVQFALISRRSTASDDYRGCALTSGPQRLDLGTRLPLSS